MSNGRFPGRKRLLSESDVEKMKTMIEQRGAYAVNTSDFEGLVNKLAAENVGKNSGGKRTAKPLSPDTISRILKGNNLKIVNGEETTDARAKAVADIRNAASFAAAQSLMAKLVPSPLFVNVDGTGYTVGKIMAAMQRCAC